MSDVQRELYAKFEEKKQAARRKPLLYDLSPIPRQPVKPDAARRVLEVREVLWGDTLLDVRHSRRTTPVTLGEGGDCTFRLSHDDLPGDGFPLVTPDGPGTAWLAFTPSMQGVVFDNGAATDLTRFIDTGEAQEWRGFFRLRLDASRAALLRFGGLQYYIHFVSPEAIRRAPFWQRIDGVMSTLMALFILGYLLTATYLKMLPAPEVADILDAPQRFARLVITPRSLPEPPPPETQRFAPTPAPRAAGEEGRIGEDDALLDKADGSARRRLEDEKVANHAGILGALDMGLEAMDRLFGGGGLGAGLDKVLGELGPLSGLDQRGAGGLGSRGAGQYGGGDALGIGGIGTRGRGGKRHSTYGIEAAKDGEKRSDMVVLKTGKPSYEGSLDKSIIERVMKRYFNQYRYCYQRELNKNPTLYGKVTVRFIIAPDGAVSSARAAVDTVGNSRVNACVLRTAKRMLFPHPKNGGRVVVTYPFIFRPTGG